MDYRTCVNDRMATIAIILNCNTLAKTRTVVALKAEIEQDHVMRKTDTNILFLPFHGFSHPLGSMVNMEKSL